MTRSISNGSKAPFWTWADDFRSTPMNRHSQCPSACPLVPKPEISPNAKPRRAFSEPHGGYALSLGSALATSRAYLANSSVTS